MPDYCDTHNNRLERGPLLRFFLNAKLNAVKVELNEDLVYENLLSTEHRTFSDHDRKIDTSHFSTKDCSKGWIYKDLRSGFFFVLHKLKSASFSERFSMIIHSLKSNSVLKRNVESIFSRTNLRLTFKCNRFLASLAKGCLS